MLLLATALVVLDVANGRVLEQRNVEPVRVSPGSAIKPFTALALLDSAGFNPGRALACRREVRVAGRQLNCSHPELTTPIDLAAALAYSCNSYFTESARRLDPGQLAATLRRFGFEAQAASDTEHLMLEAVGEWGVASTAVELAQAYRRLALLRARGDPKYDPVWAGLKGAIDFGTGQRAAPPSFDVLGKTGTTTHAWFAGFAPAANPRIVAVVLAPRGRGAIDAAPVAREAFERYLGSQTAVRVRVRGQGIRSIPLEEYVVAVLSAESSVFTQPESLKAMAVAARTYAMYYRGRHRDEGFDLCDTTHCQALRLDAVPAERLRTAAAATEGEMLWYQGQLAAAFYHRHCGGTTADARELWPSLRAPYLRQQTDTFCLRERSRWQAELGRRPGDSLQIESRTPSGRVARLRTSAGTLTAEQLHKQVGDQAGWAILRSNDYRIATQSGRFVFQGYGFGHGVGLCQAGADERARAGHDYRRILAFYYPDTVVSLNAQGFAWTRGRGERVEVLAPNQADAAELTRLGDAALRDAERRTGLNLAGGLTIRAYPSVAMYRDATGQPGWLAASTLGRTIRLQPVHDRLETILAHEMLHAVIEANAAPSLPDWFREGLALYLGPRQSPAGAVPARVREQYQRDLERVQALVNRYGRDAVLAWVRTGLPPRL